MKKTPSRQSLLMAVFSDDVENPAFHLAITYLLLWFVLVVCYLPYYIVWYYDAYDSGRAWGGFYTMSMLIIHTSFALKPVIYLGHNRHYRAVTKETIPKRVRARARAVRESVSSVVDKMDDLVFRSASNRRFAATVTAQKAVLIWKRKLQGLRQNKLHLPKKVDEKSPVVPLSISEPQTEENSEKHTKDVNAKVVPDLNGKVVKELKRKKLESQPVTPSNVDITNSSFIERERQRLIGNGNISAPPSVVCQEPTIVSPAVCDLESV